MAAWEMKPRRYKTKFQRSLYAGQTARRDAEEAERTRWIHDLSLLNLPEVLVVNVQVTQRWFHLFKQHQGF